MPVAFAQGTSSVRCCGRCVLHAARGAGGPGLRHAAGVAAAAGRSAAAPSPLASGLFLPATAAAAAVALGVRGRQRGKRASVLTRAADSGSGSVSSSSSSLPVSPAAIPPSVRDSVVKIFVTKQRFSMTVPWQTIQVESSSGSGSFIRRRGSATVAPPAADVEQGDPPYWQFSSIEHAIPEATGDLVLTAAHVVADARDVRVQLLSANGGSTEKYVARVIAVSHDSDLALLEISDVRCFCNSEVMPIFGPKELPEVQSRVQVMGFPVGGDYLSITEGVLSRVEVVEYCHSRRPAMALTVDAAINAGNSGGPVVDPITGRMVAVAHQKMVAFGVENQGQCVPPCLIWRFLHGQSNGKCLRLPSIGTYIQHLESPAHAEMLGLKEGEVGALVREVYRLPGEGPGALRMGDVLLKMGRHAVDNFGTVKLLGHRVALSAVQDLLYMGDKVPITVMREGKVTLLEAELGEPKSLVPRTLYKDSNIARPSFFIFGGLVFVPLSADFLEQAWPNAQDRPPHLMDLYYRGSVGEHLREVVVLLSILADDVNAGHGTGYVGCPIVDSVGDTKVMDLPHLVSLLEEAKRKEDYVQLEVTMSCGPYTMILKSADLPEADARIQELYQLPYLASVER